MVFRLTTSQGYIFKTIVELFQASFPRIVFSVNADGIFSRMTNIQGTILFDLNLSAENFQSFELDRPLLFGVNISQLLKILSSIKKKDSLEIFCEEEKYLHFKITGKESYAEFGSVAIEQVQTIDIDVPGPYRDGISSPSNKFNKMIKEFMNISKELYVEGNWQYIQFRSFVDGILERKIQFGAPSEITWNEVFPIDEWGKLNKLSGFGHPIFFFVQEGQPLKISTRAGGLGTLDIYICREEV